MRIAVGGSAKRMITDANQMFLFDSAYARRAEKAEPQFKLVYVCFRQEPGRTAERHQAQYLDTGLSPRIRDACTCAYVHYHR